MSYLIAILGCMIFVPFPAIGLLLFVFAVGLHQFGFAGNGVGELGELALFYGAIIGIAAMAIP